jgi:hypothetical protein
MKMVKDISIIVLAVLCVVVSLLMQPWAELGFTGNFPAWLAWAAKPIGLEHFFTELGNAPFAKAIQEFLSKQGAQANFGDYAYSLFLFAALMVAAVAIVLIGREDAEEKTLLPVKK